MGYGKGLNSIRWRFTLASAVLTAVGMAARDAVLGGPAAQAPSHWGSVFTVAALSAAVTYWMASRLTGLIAALQRSTEAIASGDFDSPVDVDCACEVGGLANSFRKMKSRFNANVMRINALAYTDPITMLPNRNVITRMLEYALAPERRDQFRAAILFIDLDGLKRVNDTLGHDGGDEVLRQASQRILERGLQRTLQTLASCMDPFGNPCDELPHDIVFARFAGDEFVAILPGVTDRNALAQVGERIIAAMAAPIVVKGQEVVVGASVGIAVTPDDTTSAAEVLSFADLAMYISKQTGKARFTFFDKRVRELMLHHAQIETELRQAIDRYELLTHFQPKLDARTLDVVGVEALVRWQHPQRGLLAPGTFIELAERARLMAPLGRRVLALAVTQCKRWFDAGRHLPVAVNVSPSQFTDPGFVEHVLQTLRDAQLPAQMLSIEITESMAMTDFEATANRLALLRDAGVKIAVDDFGIGFSNLSQLSRVPLDELKIDRSLIVGIGDNAKSEAIIRAIVGMTHALGYRTIAEGIETDAQLAFLREVGCDSVQGFLFARPMSVPALDLWLDGRPAAAVGAVQTA